VAQHTNLNPGKAGYAEGDAAIASDDAAARAEAELGRLAGEFTAWMYDECERLEAAREDVVRHGLTQKTHGPLFRAAHDIKGEAATFGYPALAGAVDSLCRLLEHTPQLTRIPIALVDQHVLAVRAIFREYDRPDHGEMAVTLTKRLRDVTDEFLEHENNFRPDYLESILAPPLVPKTSGR
jgi:HPt (histidine-containing phosphotransfer) domain-containing protein